MKTKTQIAVEHYDNEDTTTALRMASEFRIGLSEEERKQIKRGYECINHNRFYKQLGFEPMIEIGLAIQLFENKIYWPYKRGLVEA